jgi:hypothetical protein
MAGAAILIGLARARRSSAVTGQPPTRDGLFQSPALTRFFGLWLWVWFAFWDYYKLLAVPSPWFFVDARIYRAGVTTWLAGGDPWSAQVLGGHFASPPPVLPLLVPLAIIPEALFVPVWLTVCVTSAVLIVRRLGLGPVWLAFPPLLQGVLLGNPAIPAFALFVFGWEPVALMVRPHLGFAALARRRWRALGLAAGLGFVLLLISPWTLYLSEVSTIAARYQVESGGGANGTGLLYWTAVAATAGVLLFDRERAGWLASTTVAAPIGYHGLVSIMPIQNKLLAAVASVPVMGIPALVAAVALLDTAWSHSHEVAEKARSRLKPANLRSAGDPSSAVDGAPPPFEDS